MLHYIKTDSCTDGKYYLTLKTFLKKKKKERKGYCYQNQIFPIASANNNK